MKIIKLTRQYALYKEGYTHAFAFKRGVYDPEDWKYEQALNDLPRKWQRTHNGKTVRTIGVSEQEITLILLKIS